LINQRAFVINVIGILCLAFSLTMLPPMAVSAWHHDGELPDFIKTFFALISAGLILWLPTHRQAKTPRRRDGFLIVAAFWLILSMIGALPLMLGHHRLDFIDALFEATSGITTTGATVIPDLTQIRPSILFYRQELQWIGGMGLVLLAIAVLPILGMGGTQLYKAETPGPMKDERLTPRLAHTAQNLWLVYVGLTLACTLSFWAVGMPLMDSLEHSFSTLSTGGFSPYNESLAYYKNPWIDYVASIFMVAGGMNFSVHYLALRGGRPMMYFTDVEVRSFLKIIAFVVILYTAVLYGTQTYHTIKDAFHYSLFEVTSVITSTGLGITDYSVWPTFLPVMLIFISFIGGCGGSTAGGIKVMRILLLFKQALHEAFAIIHPKSIRPVRIGNQILDEKTTQGIWGFFAVYIMVFVLLTLGMMLAGLDQVSAFAAVATCINNLGPGLGRVSASFTDVSDSAKLLGVAAMLLGRLEVFTLLIILMPDYWRR
jgi:trk system potassium uptake protein TrkH